MLLTDFMSLRAVAGLPQARSVDAFESDLRILRNRADVPALFAADNSLLSSLQSSGFSPFAGFGSLEAVAGFSSSGAGVGRGPRGRLERPFTAVGIGAAGFKVWIQV